MMGSKRVAVGMREWHGMRESVLMSLQRLMLSEIELLCDSACLWVLPVMRSDGRWLAVFLC